MTVSSYNIDHGITGDNHEQPDTNGDFEGSETRNNPQAGNSDTNPTPVWILDEFEWVLKAGIANTPENRSKNGNWRMRARNTVVKETTELCTNVYKSRLPYVNNDSNLKEMQSEFYTSVLDLFRTTLAHNNWLMYSVALSLLNSGAKEIASATRFAKRANAWQTRLNQANDTEQMGPTNMLEQAFSQADRGVALCVAVIHAYNKINTNQGAINLGINNQLFQSATYTALGIEASKHAKLYDHPGKEGTRANNSAEAASTDFAAFFGGIA